MTSNEIQIQIALLITVLEIGFGPPTADFGSIWSSLVNFDNLKKNTKSACFIF